MLEAMKTAKISENNIDDLVGKILHCTLDEMQGSNDDDSTIKFYTYGGDKKDLKII